MSSRSTNINIKEIRSIYGAECEAGEGKFDEKEFEDFLNFLEIDFYDWVRENLKQFRAREAQQ